MSPRPISWRWLVGVVGVGLLLIAVVVSVGAAKRAASSGSTVGAATPASLADTCVRGGYRRDYVIVRCYLGDGLSYAQYAMDPDSARDLAPRSIVDLPPRLR